jgi:hydrogenase expression/formation protein HypE
MSIDFCAETSDSAMGQSLTTHGSIKAVLFDFDGTLTQPGALDFGHIRQVLGCPSGTPILEYIDTLGLGPARRAALARLDRFELQGASDSVPNTGAEELVTWLKERRMAVGIITRNSRACVLRALQNFQAIGPHDFDVMVTRDDPPAPKPSADGVLWAARRLGVTPAQILVVGDFIFDAQAGQAAGALTALLDPDGDERLQGVAAAFRIKGLEEIRAIVGLF